MIQEKIEAPVEEQIAYAHALTEMAMNEPELHDFYLQRAYALLCYALIEGSQNAAAPLNSMQPLMTPAMREFACQWLRDRFNPDLHDQQ